MPDAQSSPEALSTYARKITTEFQKLYPAMQTLALIDKTWPESVVEKMRVCEDLLSEYVGTIANSSHIGSSSVELQTSVLVALNTALQRIKDAQLRR
jgi:hypothetical protein